MKFEDVRIGQRVRFNNKVESGWWFKPGQTGYVTAIDDDRRHLPIAVMVDDENDIGNVEADMIELYDCSELELLRQIADDIAATRKAIESLEKRWGYKPWDTGPR